MLAFRRGHTLIVPLLYGEESDWARNLLRAGGGRAVRGGRTYELVAEVGERVAGFGRGRHAG